MSHVAIIGAGLSGLASARQILARTPQAQVTIYEVRGSVGGVWNYSPDALSSQIKFDSHGNPRAAIDFGNIDGRRNTMHVVEEVPPSPVYPSLRTNLPTPLMSFRDEPYDAAITDKTFPTHAEVLAYLHSYAHKHALIPLVRFRHRVTRVRHSPHSSSSSNNSMRRWELTVEDLSVSEKVERGEKENLHNVSPTTTRTYDCVVNAAGHYASPYIPTIDGLWAYDGVVEHSRWWRGPEAHRGRKVVVVGSRSSGYDLTRELAWLNVAPRNVHSPYASVDTHPHLHLPPTTVIQSSRSPPPEWTDAPAWYRSIHQRPPITHAHGHSVTFADGRVETGVDVLVFATGYDYLFPYMHAGDQPWKEHPVADDARGERSGQVQVQNIPAHKQLGEAEMAECARGWAGLRHNISKHHLLYLPDPSFGFVGLLKNVRPFSLYEAQAHVLAFCFAQSTSKGIPNTLTEPLHLGNQSTRAAQVWRFPLEFEMTDEMASAIGELDTCAFAVDDGVWTWACNPKWAYDRTYGLIAEKRAVLGY
ncbi:hypothetical protein E3P78_02722 [Wallemia ichthyophaga]|nr:hypothetical protein E3P78_02722 [Wallemia ichthyophaga]